MMILIKILMISLRHIGLTLNSKKTKILRCSPFEEESTINVTEIDGDFVKILGDDDSHRYLGVSYLSLLRIL